MINKGFHTTIDLCKGGSYEDIVEIAKWSDDRKQYFLGSYPLYAVLNAIGSNANISAEQYQSLMSKCPTLQMNPFRLLALKQLRCRTADNVLQLLPSRSQPALKPFVPLSQTLNIETVRSLNSGIEKYGRSGTAENIN